jgi:hypothetical protein
MNGLIYAILMGAINTWRGRGYVASGRVIAMVLWTLLSIWAAGAVGGYSWPHNLYLGLLIGAGIIYWLEHPWGQGFAAYTGVWEPRPNTVHWIENICLKVFPYPGQGKPDPKAYVRGTLFMALRGLYIAPLFVALAIVLQCPLIALAGLVGLMQGVAYGAMRWVKPCQHGHWNCQAATAEFLTLGSFSLAIAAVI